MQISVTPNGGLMSLGRGLQHVDSVRLMPDNGPSNSFSTIVVTVACQPK